MNYTIAETAIHKVLKSEVINYVFNKTDGTMMTWGKMEEEDPPFSPVGPFIADIEVTTICNGIGENGPCSFCYKSNTSNGINMSLETFKEIFAKLPKALTQIAFGVDAKCESNPDIWDIMDHCRENGVIPNLTVADITVDVAKKIAMRAGAVAVSHYGDESIFWNTIWKLNSCQRDPGATLKQINIHQLVSEETIDNIDNILGELERCALGSNIINAADAINAIVFLSLKKTGRGKNSTPVSQEVFTSIVKRCLDSRIPFGFDSCSAAKVVQAYKDLGLEPPMEYIDPCESTLTSIYCSAGGYFFPCSFCDGHSGGIYYKDVENFYSDVWFANTTSWFRNKLIRNLDKNGVRQCLVYDI